MQRSSSGSGELGAVYYLLCCNALGTAFAGTGVNWEPHFTTDPTSGMSPWGSAEHWTTLQRTFLVKDLPELVLISSLDAVKMLEHVPPSHSLAACTLNGQRGRFGVVLCCGSIDLHRLSGLSAHQPQPLPQRPQTHA